MKATLISPRSIFSAAAFLGAAVCFPLHVVGAQTPATSNHAAGLELRVSTSVRHAGASVHFEFARVRHALVIPLIGVRMAHIPVPGIGTLALDPRFLLPTVIAPIAVHGGHASRTISIVDRSLPPLVAQAFAFDLHGGELSPPTAFHIGSPGIANTCPPSSPGGSINHTTWDYSLPATAPCPAPGGYLSVVHKVSIGGGSYVYLFVDTQLFVLDPITNLMTMTGTQELDSGDSLELRHYTTAPTDPSGGTLLTSVQ